MSGHCTAGSKSRRVKAAVQRQDRCIPQSLPESSWDPSMSIIIHHNSWLSVIHYLKLVLPAALKGPVSMLDLKFYSGSHPQDT
ncbi:hypothetical protein EXN66_Car000430 [Channa argus]|uniref:Uncharacterized protein n=1 Tax=Channa argus TaxID=215402 RepID=A0A6G1QXP7_CHAAH|nr:hypothetical protein EXN66_Car000430 [Channa argus]